jgi:hypothetical protein
MSGLITNMHPITRTRRFTQEKEIFTQIPLVVKMHMDLMKSKAIQNNLVLFGDFELILGLPYLLPILEVLHTLIKLA